ncbi:hypothetical protein [Lysinibacillus sp. 54212]|uniref:hypothetical protein n=1 Tax=Lysinibacillus sp. 54212 TaxID=3119829 RepID=UPI002FC87B08
MFINQRITSKSIIRACIFGTLFGLCGVGLFAVLLLSANDEKEEVADTEKQTVVNATKNESTLFYASQHGAFSTLEGASQLVAAHPTLNKSAIVEVDGQFYVWSKISTAKLTEETIPSSFSKAFTISSNACPSKAIAKVPVHLKDEHALKIYFEKNDGIKDLPKDWESFMQSIATLSEDVNVIRLHTLSYYLTENECLKIDFNS